MRRLGFSSVIMLFVSVLNLAAQETPSPSLSPDNVALQTAPDKVLEWTVEVHTSGGLTGAGTGGFIVTSMGRLTCDSPKRCDRKLETPIMKTLDQSVNTLDVSQLFRQPAEGSSQARIPASLCLDCVVSSLVLRLRDSKKVEWIYEVSWDVTTQSKVPLDVMQVFRTVTSIAK